MFESLDTFFKTPSSEIITKTKQDVTNQFLEIQLYIVVLKEIYPKIKLNEFVEIIEFFTDAIYADQDKNIEQFKSTYFAAKLHIYNKLYQFALKKELSILA